MSSEVRLFLSSLDKNTYYSATRVESIDFAPKSLKINWDKKSVDIPWRHLLFLNWALILETW